MSPDAQAKRLLAICDEIDTARRLVECGWLASQGLSGTEQSALGELLDLIVNRLETVSKRLAAEYADQAA